MTAQKRVAIGLAFAFVSGCASRTRITAQDGAEIYTESNELIGVGTAPYKDRKPVWGTTTFRVEKQGCETAHLTIDRSDELAIGPLIGGLFVLFPFFWTGNYRESYGVHMVCNRGTETAARETEE